MTARRIFLTGFPGFLGRRLVVELLRQRPDAAIDALVEPRMLPAAEAARAALDRALPGAHARLRLHPGDLTSPDLGLGAAYPALAADATDIFHLAAVYDLAVPREVAYRVNVLGTAHLLAFAARCPALRRLNYVSTAYVAGDRTGLVGEDDLDAGQGFKNHYEWTKFRAERLVRAAMPDLPTTIYRPAIVVGDSRTGETDKFDGPYFAMRFIERLDRWRLPAPMIGRGDALANLVPVDYVVAAILHLARDPAAVARAVHLCDPDGPTAWSVFRQCAELITGREPFWSLSPALAAIALRLCPLRRLLGVPREALAYFDHPVTFGTTNAYALLSPAGIAPPPFADYAEPLVDFFLDHCDDPRYLRDPS